MPRNLRAVGAIFYYKIANLMNAQTIHTIITAGTTYMVLGTAAALFCLYKLAKAGFFRDFFSTKTANNG